MASEKPWDIATNGTYTMASSDAAAANTRMRYMTTNAGVRTASPGSYCRTAATLLRRLRFTRLSMAHTLGSISGGHQPLGGSRKSTAQTATTIRTHRTTPAHEGQSASRGHNAAVADAAPFWTTTKRARPHSAPVALDPLVVCRAVTAPR